MTTGVVGTSSLSYRAIMRKHGFVMETTDWMFKNKRELARFDLQRKLKIGR